MCLIAIAMPGQSFDPILKERKDIEICNRDGVGMVAYTTEKFSIKRSPHWTKAMQILVEDTSLTRIVHWRFGTSGTKQVRLVHPMRCGKSDIWLMQNGITSNWGDKDHSDTWYLANQLIAPMRLGGASMFQCTEVLRKIDSVSRFVLFSHQTRDVHYIGHWVVQSKDMLYTSTDLPSIVWDRQRLIWEKSPSAYSCDTGYGFKRGSQDYPITYGKDNTPLPIEGFGPSTEQAKKSKRQAKRERQARAFRIGAQRYFKKFIKH